MRHIASLSVSVHDRLGARTMKLLQPMLQRPVVNSLTLLTILNRAVLAVRKVRMLSESAVDDGSFSHLFS
jgi:hypothetical protein